MKKVLSFVVPCYNSDGYMRHCIDSLLIGGEDVEIIIVNDGSVDNTAGIANHYISEYPNIVKAIHQENGGHGEAINIGLKYATGKFFKVIDSDDWVDEKAYLQILKTLKKLIQEPIQLDMFISNFVYEKSELKKKKVMKYNNALPENTFFTWDEVKKFKIGQYMLMHSITYRTQLLKDIGLTLPKHTFYVDNLFAYVPMQYVENMYYLDIDFYRYFIGREDQSISESIMIGRIDQQIKVNKMMLKAVRLEKIESENLRQYLHHYFEIVTSVSSVLLMRSGTKENLKKKKILWEYIRQIDRKMYKKLRRGILGLIINLPIALGRIISNCIYKISKKIVGFN